MKNWTQAISPKKDNTRENIIKVLDHLGHPQDQIPTIHIGGTNAKGSIQAYIREIFIQAGYRVGTFTSPYLLDVKETIQINNQNISREDFDKLDTYIRHMAKELGTPLTDFEVLTAMSYHYFALEELDVSVVEVGLGGRDDATNVLSHPIAVAFGPIALDHTDILGDSLEQIARVKADIIKDGTRVYSLDQDPRVRQILDEKANTQITYISPKDLDLIDLGFASTRFSYNGQTYQTGMPGAHQAQNASLAISLTDDLTNIYPRLKDGQIPGIQKVQIPARIQALKDRPKILVDGGHNENSLRALKAYLKSTQYSRLVLGFGILKDKNWQIFCDELFGLADEIILTWPKSPRALDPKVIHESLGENLRAKTHVEEDIKSAIDLSLELAGADDLILWCGSFYLAKDIKAHLD